MRLYAGTSRNFIDLNLNNQIADIIKTEFISKYGHNPSDGEVASWRNSLLRLSLVLQQAGVKDAGVLVEYKLPLSSRRIDVILTGKDASQTKNAVIIELKQWGRCELTDYDSEKVVTWVGKGNRQVLHPSVQAGNYMYCLQENNSAFYKENNPVKLHACCFLHNYAPTKQDPIFDYRFEPALNRFPIFTIDDTDKIAIHILQYLSEGEGMDIIAEIESSKLRPSTKLMNQVSTTIKDKLKSKGAFKVFGQHKVKEDYILLDEQLIVYDNIMSLVKSGMSQRHQYVIIAKGGCGTGKSIIGLQLLADLISLGHNAHYATGSKSFTQTLRRIVGRESESLFKYFMSYGDANPKEMDVLILDESHRIREKTNYPFKPTGNPQVEDLIKAAKIAVFFIDDYQTVRKGEIGSSQYIKDHAERLGCKVYEYELKSQFRCGGSDGFTNWINNTLHVYDTANAFWEDEPDFEFKIFGSPEELEHAIIEKNKEGYTARITAGFCWEWSKTLNEDNSLIEDIRIGSFKRPWNARPELTGLKRGIPKADFWAYEDEVSIR